LPAKLAIVAELLPAELEVHDKTDLDAEGLGKREAESESGQYGAPRV